MHRVVKRKVPASRKRPGRLRLQALTPFLSHTQEGTEG